MKFLLRLTAWATLAFFVSWWLHPGWQHVIGGLSARLAAPPGTEIEVTDIEVFFPFDLGVFCALCLASSWVSRARRWRAIAIGMPALIGVEVLTLVLSFKVMLSHADAEQMSRLTYAIIRMSELVPPSAAWLYLLGRERLSLATRQWLGS